MKKLGSMTITVSNIFSGKYNQIVLTVKPNEKIFEIESKNTDIGENTTLLSGALSGDSVSANFNYKYILDCFQSIGGDSLSIELNGNNGQGDHGKPAVTKSSVYIPIVAP